MGLDPDWKEPWQEERPVEDPSRRTWPSCCQSIQWWRQTTSSVCCTVNHLPNVTWGSEITCPTKINKVDPLLTEITNPILKNETFPSTATDKIPPNRLVVFLCPCRPSSLSHPCLSRLSRVLCPRPCPCLSRPFPSPLLCLWQGPWGLVPLYRLSNLCPFPFRLFHLCPSHLCLKTGMVATTPQDNSRGLWKAGNQRVVSSPEKQSLGSNIRGFHSYCMGPRWFTHHLRPLKNDHLRPLTSRWVAIICAPKTITCAPKLSQRNILPRGTALEIGRRANYHGTI